MNKYHKETFGKIPEDKQETILKAATTEFAKKGFNAANINIIAENAGISIGSMYNYFASKEDLFLTVIERGYNLLEKAISDVDLEAGDIFDKCENLLRAAQRYSKKYPELNQVYLDITSEGLAHLSRKLSRKMETITALYYRTIINESKENGTVASEVDEYILSFCLDNLILLLQFSYTSEYYRERMKIFAGENSLDEDERIIKGMMMFIRGGISGLKEIPVNT
ncbi:MAG: TetR/AcrR family transcriptional regulator [bacterium]|nr:TetR/AcrR family transcriptional regulator [bacterium]